MVKKDKNEKEKKEQKEQKDKKYKLIIAGNRNINDFKILNKAIFYANIKPEEIEEVVSGCSSGVDKMGEIWAKNNNIKIKEFPAMWEDLESQPVYIKTRRDGTTYNALAGFARNKKMAQYADKLLAILPPENSPGTKNMIEEMKSINKPVIVYEI